MCTEVPSRILVGPEDQRVVDGGVASFFCLASGRPPPAVHWWRAGRRISPGRQRYLTVNVTGDGGGWVLRVEPARARKDDGVIECRADNGVAVAATATAKLEVYADAAAGRTMSCYKWFHNRLRSFACGYIGKTAASMAAAICTQTDSHVTADSHV